MAGLETTPTAPEPDDSRARDALVLGASSPIGAALCAALEARSWRVRRHRRAPEAGEGATPAWIYADLANSDELTHLAREVEAKAPSLLVVAASLFWPSRAASLEPQQAQEAFAINALAPLLIGDAQLRGAARLGQPATQIHLSDLAGREPFLGAAGYSLTQAAADNALRQLLRRSGAQDAVVTLELGVVAIPGRPRNDEAAIASRDTFPGRAASIPELVDSFLAILSRPRAFHGARLRLDGGLAMREVRREPAE